MYFGRSSASGKNQIADIYRGVTIQYVKKLKFQEQKHLNNTLYKKKEEKFVNTFFVVFLLVNLL